ncbi:MAG: hypothetical protein ACOYJB_02915 [Christensenellaceae bacterium]|jgi:hypothetical protein
MLDFWNSLELFDKVSMVIIIVCVLILALCIYKIVRWFKRDDVVRRRELFRQERQTHGLFPLYQKIGNWRLVNSIVFVGIIIAANALLLKHAQRSMAILMTLVGIVAMTVINNIIMTTNWKCPQCHNPLPRILGRTSLRPKLVDNCPHCGHIWKEP